MADPFDDIFGQQQQQIPVLPPEAAQSSIDQIGSGLLGGLGYFGDVLDKTFGGRAIRSLVGGATGGKFNPSELLSVLPFSDTLGLTDIKNRVTGKQILQNSGIVNKGASSDGSFGLDDILGIGTEIALDPASWVGAAVPRAVLGGLNKGAKAASGGLGALTGGRVNPYSYLGRQAERVGTVGNALFDPSSQGAWNPINQKLAQTVYTPGLKAGQSLAEANYMRALTPADELVKSGRVDANVLNSALLDAGEGFTSRAQQKLADSQLQPNEIDQIINHASNEAERVRSSTIAQERNTGVLSKEATDVPEWLDQAQQAAAAAGQQLPPELANKQFAKYVPRTIEDLLDGGMPAARGQRDALSGISSFQAGREDVLKGLGGTTSINDLVKSPEFTGANRTQTDLQVNHHLSQMLTGHGSGAIPQSWAGTPWGQQAWEGAQAQVKELSQKLKNYTEPVQQKGLFKEDLFGNLKARELESARVTTSGKTILAGLDPKMGQIQPITSLQQAGTPFVRVPEFLDAAGLTHGDVAASTAARQLGLNPQQLTSLKGTLAQYGLPQDVAQDMLRIGAAWKTPDALKPVIDAWDKATQIIKSNLTYPFPGFHFRNVMSGMFNMWRDNALSTSAMKTMSEVQRGGSLSAEQAAKLYPGLPLDAASREFRNELIANKISFVRNNQVADKIGPTSAMRGGFMPGELPAVGGQPSTIAEGAKSIASAYAPTKGHLNPLNPEEFFLTKGGTAAGNAAEDWIRGTHYLAKRLAGAAPAEAKLSTMKYQIDYGELTQFEKNVMKRLFPFYSFSRRNLPPILEDLASKPAKLAGGIRLSTSRQDNEFTPSWISEGTAIPIGKTPEGFSRYINSLGMPYEDEGIKALGSVLAGKGSRALQTVLGQSAPQVKFPIEEAMGVQMHTGRKLADLRPSPVVAGLGDLLQGAGIDHPSTKSEQLLSELLSATPASRFATTAGKLVDTRKDAATKALSLLTGTNVTDVDVPKTQLIGARDEIMDMLRGSPNVRHFEEFNVPKDKVGALTPQELEAYQMYKAVEAKAKEAAAKRKAAASGGLPF
jgi:hypothetical protein